MQKPYLSIMAFVPCSVRRKPRLELPHSLGGDRLRRSAASPVGEAAKLEWRFSTTIRSDAFGYRCTRHSEYRVEDADMKCLPLLAYLGSRVEQP
jgi:hypothetical protein